MDSDKLSKEEVKDAVLEAMAASLEAQARAVRRLRGAEPAVEKPKKRMSQTLMAYDVLQKASAPLHIMEMIRRIEIAHGVRADRESLVSALLKKVARGDRFARTAPNTFGLLGRDAPC